MDTKIETKKVENNKSYKAANKNDVRNNILAYIQNESIGVRRRRCKLTNLQIQQLFGCSKDELVVVLNQLKNNRTIFAFHVSRSGITIIFSKEDRIPPGGKFDVFISHATKDKISYVDELHSELEKLGVNIFYDKKEISWGDNWKDRILEATEQSEFAIIIISENFFDREWTEKELELFLNRQNKNGQKTVLTILHKITQEEFLKHYNELSEIQYITTEKNTQKDIAILFAKEYIKRIKNRWML